MNTTSTGGPRLFDDRYEVKDELGSGASGVVLRAADRMLGGSEVALKVLNPRLLESKAVLSKLRQWIVQARQLAHPNIVRVFDFCHTGETFYISMEYVPGWNLRQLLDARPKGAMPLEATTAILSFILHALAHAERRGIVHGNLKPENILITREGVVKVSDFAVADALEHEMGLTLTGELASAPSYMAPERFRGEAATHQSDLYSFAMLAHHLVKGRPPFQNENFLELARTHHTMVFPSLAEGREAAPPWLDALVKRCAEKAPEARPASIKEALDELRASAPAAASLARQVRQFLPKRRRGWSWKRSAGFLAFLICASAWGVFTSLQQNNLRRGILPVVFRAEQAVGLRLSFFKTILGAPALLIDDEHVEPTLADSKRVMELYYRIPAGDPRVDAADRAADSLIDAGADIDFFIGDEHLLHYAASNAKYETVAYLLQHAKDINVRSKSGETVLHAAVRRAEQMKLNLLTEFPLHLNVRNNEGLTPLHLAVQLRKPEAVRLLLEAGADPDQRGPQGSSALMMTTLSYTDAEEVASMMRLLLEFGASTQARDHLGRTPLHYAVYERLYEAIPVLLEAGADPHSRDQEGQSALEMAEALLDQTMVGLLTGNATN